VFLKKFQGHIEPILGCHHVHNFMDPPKSVLESVTYVPSTLSSRSNFCSPICFVFTRVYVRTTRVYYLLCCCCSSSSSCSSWDISQNTAVYTKLVPFHHAFSILQCNLQFAICNLQFAICNLQFAICNLQF
jgi:hypothetical protein